MNRRTHSGEHERFWSNRISRLKRNAPLAHAHPPGSNRAMNEKTFETIDSRADELAELTADLIRFPTINPPGEAYTPCAEYIGERLRKRGFTVEYVRGIGTPGDSDRYPRWNLLARREGGRPGPCVHFNGHIDVVEVGHGWTVDPFGGEVIDGRLYGRGACDMKGGLAAAIVAVEAFLARWPEFPGAIEISATADEAEASASSAAAAIRGSEERRMAVGSRGSFLVLARGAGATVEPFVMVPRKRRPRRGQGAEARPRRRDGGRAGPRPRPRSGGAHAREASRRRLPPDDASFARAPASDRHELLARPLGSQDLAARPQHRRRDLARGHDPVAALRVSEGDFPKSAVWYPLS